MSNTIKAIKIDVERQEVYEIEIENTLQGKYDAIGNDCELIEVGGYFPRMTEPFSRPRDVMYVDEEIAAKLGFEFARILDVGVFKYAIPPYSQNAEARQESIIRQCVGNAIIVGTDQEGNSVNHHQTIESIKERILGFRREPIEG